MRHTTLLIFGLLALALAGANFFVAAAHAENATVYGNKQAKLRIVEFVDYQCPYCQIVHQRLNEALKADNNASVEIIPLPWVSEESAEVAKLVLAAKLQGKDLALHQELLNQSAPQSLGQAKDIAKSLGIDMAQAERDMSSKAIKDQVEANLRMAIDLKMKTTPGLLIGDTLYTPGKDEMPTVNQLRLMIDEHTKP